MEKSQQNSAQFWSDIKSEGFDEAWVMPVAEEHFWIHCLVLVPVGGDSNDVAENDGPQRRFRRVGKCHVDNLKSREFFTEKKKLRIELV